MTTPQLRAVSRQLYAEPVSKPVVRLSSQSKGASNALTAIQTKKGEPIKFFCGCFTGSEKELRHYIKYGAKHLAKTRTLALETCLTLIEAKNEGPE